MTTTFNRPRSPSRRSPIRSILKNPMPPGASRKASDDTPTGSFPDTTPNQEGNKSPFIPPLHSPSEQHIPGVFSDSTPWPRGQTPPSYDPRAIPPIPPYANPYNPPIMPLTPGSYPLMPDAFIPSQLPMGHRTPPLAYPAFPSGTPAGPSPFINPTGHAPQGWGQNPSSHAFSPPQTVSPNGLIPVNMTVWVSPNSVPPHMSPGQAMPVPRSNDNPHPRLSRPKHDFQDEAPVSRSNVIHIDEWAVGDNYGPVLGPSIARAVQANIIINPLLMPPPHGGKFGVIKWNMLFPPSYARHSSDPSEDTWHDVRDQPATIPRLSSLRVVSRSFPWILDIRAVHHPTGVTCGDVVKFLHEGLHAYLKTTEVSEVSSDRNELMTDCYYAHRSVPSKEPGRSLTKGIKGMRRVDWLCEDVMFGGLEDDEGFVKEKLAFALPGTLTLRCDKEVLGVDVFTNPVSGEDEVKP